MSKLSVQESLMEYIRCVNDPIYAIENYLKTHDVTSKGYVPFKLFEKQKELVWSYENFQETIATKSRQQGVTTTSAAYYAVKMMLAPKSNPERVVIVTNKLDGSKKILAQVTEFIIQLSEHPFFFIDQENPSGKLEIPKKVFSTKSKTEVFLEHNGSSVKAISSGVDASRGLVGTKVLLDEASFLENGPEIYRALIPLISTGGSVSLVSTANGRDPLYYELYQGALNKTNSFNLVEMRWYQDPRFNKDLQWIKDDETIDEKDFTIESYKKKVEDGYKPTSTWYRNMCAKCNGDLRTIAQEIDVDFLNSGGNVVSDIAQKEQREKNIIEQPAFQDPEYPDMWVWKTPDEVTGKRIIMSIDPSSGSGADNAAIEILNVDYVDEDGNPGIDQIAQFYGKLKPDELGTLGYKYALLYDCFVVVDCIGGWGFDTLTPFLENKYKKLYYDTLSNQMSSLLVDSKKFNSHKSTNGKPPGFHNPAHRTLICNRVASVIEHNTLKIRSTRTLNELGTWIWVNNRPDHARSAHDDSIMGIGLGIFVYENAYQALKISETTLKANLTAFSATSYGNAGSSSNRTGGSISSNQGTKEVGKKELPKTTQIPIFGGSYGSPNFTPRVTHGSGGNADYAWLFKK